MTIQDFVTALATATPDDWFMDIVLEGRMIRRTDAGRRVCCPITSLGQARFPIGYPADAKRLGLSQYDAETIAVTADDLRDHPQYDPALREALLKATVARERPAVDHAA